MRKFEAVEVTMKKPEDVGDAHVDASYARDPTRNDNKEMGSRRKRRNQSYIKKAKSLMRRSLVYGAKEMLIPVKSALQKMQHATFVASKDTLNEHFLRKRDKANDPNTNMLSIFQLNKTVVNMMMNLI